MDANSIAAREVEMDWKQEGESKMTPEQQRMLNAICSDLASHIRWHGQRLTKDDFRHILVGTVKGWKLLPGIDRGQGAPGFIYLGGSSKDLSKSQASEAITMAVQIGDHPDEQGLDAKPIRWSDTVLIGLGFNPRDME